MRRAVKFNECYIFIYIDDPNAEKWNVRVKFQKCYVLQSLKTAASIE